ncbi:MAG: ABC transporter ATP-binding protein [Anaerolineae bacterium]
MHLKIQLNAYWTLLVRHLRPQWRRSVLMIVLLLGSISLQLVNPQIMRVFIDTAQAGGPSERLLRAALFFIAVALVQQVAAVLSAYVSENVAWTATNSLRSELADHCLRLDMSFHNAHTPGEMIERVDGDVTTLANFFSQFVIRVIGNALLLAGILALLFREDWRVGLVMTGFSVLALLTLGRLRNIAVPHWVGERQASADLFGFLEERLSGTEDIRSNGAESYVMGRFYRLVRKLLQRSLKAGLMVNILLNSMYVLFSLGVAAAFAVGAWLFYAEVLTIGTVYIIFHYTNMLERPITQISRQLEDLQKAGAGITRIQELLDTHTSLQDGRLESKLPLGPLAVEFRDVSFGYKDGEQSGAQGPEMVLRDLTFRLKAGVVLGLLGRTGSGKTTLTRLLFRFYDPDSGLIGLGGAVTTVDARATSPAGRVPDIRELRLVDVRRRVGMVTQNIQLFHASVRENLTFFDESIPEARILEVLDDLGLGEWCRSLPEGLDTELESGSGGLSAGEAQLLAFARIFLQDPGLVILDEASSRLDPATERLIERAVDKLVENRTAIIIAHRLGTVQRADEIMILEDGNIREYGPRSDLANDPSSRFYHLLQTGLEEVLA